MRKILIMVLVLFLIPENALCGHSHGYVFDGDGQYTHPNNGYLYSYSDMSGAGTYFGTSATYQTLGNDVYYNYNGNVNIDSGCIQVHPLVCGIAQVALDPAYDNLYVSGICNGATHTETMSGMFNSTTGYAAYSYVSTGCYDSCSGANMVIYVSTTPFNDYTISGSTCGVTEAALYFYDASYGYKLMNVSSLDSTGDSYSFDIIEDYSYKVIFSDSHEYGFTCDGNEVYDRDMCSHYTINLFDDCANMLINPYTTIYKSAFIPILLYRGYDNPINLLIGIDVELGDVIDITVHTCDGDIMLHDGYVEERVINMFHQGISWDMDIHVVDDNTGANIPQAKVTRTQDCCIVGDPSGYALTQSNGRVCFSGLANSNIDITVEKSGYNTRSTTIGVGNCFNCQSDGAQFTVYLNSTTGDSTDDFNNGTHNDSENIDGTGEETLPSDNTFGCGVYFKNVDGYIVGSIYDTDAYVDMYWWVKNHDGGDSDLKFQYQLYTHWYDAQTYTVSNNTYEYRRIYNADFNDHTNSYRGYIYNATEGCNDIQILRVLNQSYEEETHYENLTAHCHFMHKLGGNEIDYRSDVEIKIYANSTNSTLLNINAYLMNGTSVVDSKVLNWADFSSGSPKWWYVWEPSYDYTSGYNYTVNITGFDGYQLDTDDVWTSNIIGNTLTVNVKDNRGVALTHSTVFVEGWGSQASGSSSSVSITGISNGDTQYRATKSGYISSSWATITLSDSDESVTCVLVKESSTIATGVKLNDSEIKSFFIPCMYLLFILILVGGVTNAVKK